MPLAVMLDIGMFDPPYFRISLKTKVERSAFPCFSFSKSSSFLQAQKAMQIRKKQQATNILGWLIAHDLIFSFAACVSPFNKILWLAAWHIKLSVNFSRVACFNSPFR